VVFVRVPVAVSSLALVAIALSGCGPTAVVVADGSTSGSSEGTDLEATIGSTETSVEPTGIDDTGLEPGCGNGIVESGEACDGDELAGATCEGQGFASGMLSCDGGCAYDTSGCSDLPAVPLLTLGFSRIKRFDFSWGAVAGAGYYQLLERASPGDPLVRIEGDTMEESISVEMPLHLRHQASYVLRACNAAGCVESDEVPVMSSLAEAVGYVQAANAVGWEEGFGRAVALSGDGDTLAVGAPFEGTSSGEVYVFVYDGVTWSEQASLTASHPDSLQGFGSRIALSDDGDTLVVGAPREDAGANRSGSAYVFVRAGMVWSEQAYLKASYPGVSDEFGSSVALSADGDTLAIGARGEDSNATGIDGDEADDSVSGSGAVYVLVRDGAGGWSQQAFVKASNPDSSSHFGSSVALSHDGNILAVGSDFENSGTTGINSIPNDDAQNSGATYVFVRVGLAWAQQAYIKASNTDVEDYFGTSVVLSADGYTLAVGAIGEASLAPGIDGDQGNAISAVGAVYVFVRDGMGPWTQQAYVKASNPDYLDEFGWSIALSNDGDILAISAPNEDGDASGVHSADDDDSLDDAGAVYVLERDGVTDAWSQQAYVKASSSGLDDNFGSYLALSGDGNILAVGGHQSGTGAVYLY
jgi:hypothetical protein